MFKWLRDARRLPQVEKDLDAALQRVSHLEYTTIKAQGEAAAANKELGELKAKLRQQNEADLLFVSMQITKRLMEGEKRDSSDLQSLLSQQARLAQNVYPQGAYNSGLLGGLGNIFGYPGSNYPFQ